MPLGTTESYPLPGVTTLIRVEPRAWVRDAQDNLIQGCFRAGGVYLPVAAPPAAAITPPASDSGGGWNTAVTVLTAASLAVGTAATLAAWGKKQ